MNFDLRLPLGLIFSIFGSMLTVHGLTTDASLYAKSLGLNVNLGWGLVMLGFGLTMLGLARRGRAGTDD
jgi:uncharacterized membrane protein YhiD involved in acid resistance